MLAKEGILFCLIGAIIVLAGVLFGWLPLTITGSVLLLVFIWFFRDPVREIQDLPNCIFSGADGQVADIDEIVLENERYIRVGIFMSPLDVHVNRAPIAGTVADVVYKKGKNYPAYDPKSYTVNQQNTITLDTSRGRMVFRQLAGMLARRTVCYLEKDDKVAQGQKIGIIKFSSRFEHYIPMSAKINVSTGDKVKAGITVIARF